jgi:hypothetical protein
MAIDPMKSHGFHGQTGPKRWPIALLERARAVPEESPGGRRALESPPIGESGGKMVENRGKMVGNPWEMAHRNRWFTYW